MQEHRVLTGVQTQPAPQQTKFKRTKRVGIYGGTFNPIHNAHLLIAEQVYANLCLDRVDFLPDAIPPHVDRKKAVDADLRLQMLELAVKDNPHFGIEKAELHRGGVSYTYDTMKRLINQHPDTDYYFIIGGDMVDYLPTWHRIEELVRLPRFHFVAVRRQGAQNMTKYPVIWIDVPTVAFSSTDIRRRVQQGTTIRYMGPQAVADFIKEHQLYHD